MPDTSRQTEKASPRRLQKARDDGDFPAAREFVSAVQFFSFILLASAYFPTWLQSIQAAFQAALRQSFSASLTPNDLLIILTRLSTAVLRPLAILGVALLAVTVFFQMASTNMGFSLSRLAPKFARLNPVRKLKDMPGNNMASLFQALVMIPVMFWLTWMMLRDRLPELLRLPMMSVATSAAASGLLLKDAMKKAAFVLVLLGLVMLVRERSKYSKRLRMSKQEQRDELKDMEGNPQTKARIRRIQRDMRRKNMMREIATATAIIVNPTHYAVAIRYEQGAMAAPLVVAKGKNYLAARIRQRANENQVPIIENPPLAQALYKSVDVGQEIPAHLYRAVAEILAYIFKLMGNTGTQMTANLLQAQAAGVKTPRFSLETLSELAVPAAVLAIVVALIAPMPSFLLDFLIVGDIMMSVIVLMVAMYITKPVDFNVFPTTLLMLTLFRLALNVSSSRLILLNGHTGPSAAGDVIQAFGNFVVGGNYIIGAVIFLVLIAIQYIVINHGAVRISEVTARFTLDALPGKQMSIDSDLNAGLIDEAEARRRRKQLAGEAEFFGAMDGASKFTQRDAVAGVLITGINIIAGLLIGVLQHGVDVMKALQTYTVLTIGDGLVTVIPALMISISGAMIITRASSENRIGVEFQKQIFGAPQPLMLSGGVLIALAAFPGLPTLPFLLLGSGVGAIGWRMKKRASQALLPETAASGPRPAKENLDDLLRVEPLSIEVGVSLISFIAEGVNSPLLRRIGSIRKQLATELGFIIPAVRVTDNLSLRAREYSICLKGIEIARFELPLGSELAIALTSAEAPPDGKPTKDPAFGVAAWWVPASQADSVRARGFTVIDPLSVMTTHLSELIKRFAYELFSRQEARKLLDRVSIDNARVVEDLVPKLLPLATAQRVIQNLLRERVSIRDAVSILEALGEAAPATRNPVLLTDYVRQSIRRSIVKPYLNANGDLPAYFLEPQLERFTEGGVEHGESNSSFALAPAALRDLLDRFGRGVGPIDSPTIVITSSSCRFFLRQAVESSIPNLFFLAHSEIPAGVKVISQGVIQ